MKRKDFTYISRSIKIRDRLSPKSQELPDTVDEPVAMLTEVDDDFRRTRARFLSELRNRGDHPYQSTHTRLYSWVSEEDSLCTVGFERSHPAAFGGNTGAITIWEPRIVLPEQGISAILYDQLMETSQEFFGDLARFALFDEVDPGLVIGSIGSLNFQAYFKHHVADLPTFFAGVKEQAQQLCQREDFVDCELAFKLLLTKFEFHDNIPLNPPAEKIFSIEAHLAREEELLKKYR